MVRADRGMHRLRRWGIFDVVNVLLMSFVFVVTLYPFVFILSSSLSDPAAVMRNEILVIPKGPTLVNYGYVFASGGIGLAYWNTIQITVFGTLTNLVLTLMTAYPLSRARFYGRRTFMKLITFTLVFSGGLIPTFLTVRALGLLNRFLGVILVGAISTWNLIVARTFFETIPESLEESALIDGAGEWRILGSIFIPLSGPIVATLCLFYAVGHWNSFFGPLIYLNDKNKYPLQIYLRKLLIDQNMTQFQGADGGSLVGVVQQSVKYTIIIVATVPILVLYPFLQKYFVKGVMVGAIKG
jgi:putative aldouronate transport system permease protein